MQLDEKIRFMANQGKPTRIIARELGVTEALVVAVLNIERFRIRK